MGFPRHSQAGRSPCLRKRGNAIRCAVSQRLNGHGGLAAAGSYQAAAVAKEEVGDVMGAMIGIDHRRLWVGAHTAGTQKMDGKLLRIDGLMPFVLGARRIQYFHGAIFHPGDQFQIVRESW